MAAAHDPEHELLLTLAGTAERRRHSEEQVQQLIPRVDWSRLERLLEDGRLFPSLGPRLAELVPSAAAARFLEALAQARQAAGSDEIVYQLTFGQVHTALSERGIRSALLKGPLLGRAAYGEAGRRLCSDVDVLVPAEDLNEAAAVLRDLGYAPPTDYLDEGGLPLLHLTMVHSQNRLPSVELHWRIHWYERDFARRHLLPSEPDTPADWRPAPAAEFASLLLFYARDGFTGLRYPSDISGWWDRHGAELDPADFDRILTFHPALQPALTAALEVAEETIGIPSRQLTDGRALGRRGRVAVRLADPQPYRSLEQAYAEISLIDGLLAPRRLLGEYARRQIAPPPAVIREHAERAGDKAVSRVGYSVRTLLRYALALSRVVGLPLGTRVRFVR
ncbi:MAG: nucleotidyltransferase family protein [Solirubrobacterales bacterium]